MRGKGVLLCLAVAAGCATVEPRGTGDLGIVVERASGRVAVVETTTPARLSPQIELYRQRYAQSRSRHQLGCHAAQRCRSRMRREYVSRMRRS